MNSIAYSFHCNCCDQDGVQLRRPHVEVDLGFVCKPCRVQVGFAHRELKRSGFRLCSHVAELHERRALIGVKKGGAK